MKATRLAEMNIRGKKSNELIRHYRCYIYHYSIYHERCTLQNVSGVCHFPSLNDYLMELPISCIVCLLSHLNKVSSFQYQRPLLHVTVRLKSTKVKANRITFPFISSRDFRVVISKYNVIKFEFQIY